eukprot:SAG11_NODE_3131_length_2664_cov_5.587914_4_plen_153_part_01
MAPCNCDSSLMSGAQQPQQRPPSGAEGGRSTVFAATTENGEVQQLQRIQIDAVGRQCHISHPSDPLCSVEGGVQVSAGARCGVTQSGEIYAWFTPGCDSQNYEECQISVGTPSRYVRPAVLRSSFARLSMHTSVSCDQATPLRYSALALAGM